MREQTIFGTKIPALSLEELRGLDVAKRQEIANAIEDEIEATASKMRIGAGSDRNAPLRMGILVAERRRVKMANAVASGEMTERTARYAF